MKALLIKDFYTIGKKLKIFLLIIAFLSCLNGYKISSFAIVYSAMLPITALAYDERSHWNDLAKMMPYSGETIVLGKYVLGYLSVLGVSVLSLIARVVIALIYHTPINAESISAIVATACIGTILQAVNLPFMIKLGVEKGRIAFFITIAAFVFGINTISDKILPIVKSASNSFTLISINFIAIIIIVNILSMLISVKLYDQKNK